MQRSATFTGPGITISPSAHRLTVRGSTSSALAAASCDSPSAASAARKSSADNGAIVQHAETVRRQPGADLFQVFVSGEGAVERAVAQEERLALRAVRPLRDEPEGIGRKVLGRGGALLAHGFYIGRYALVCKGYFRAVATITHPQETGDGE